MTERLNKLSVAITTFNGSLFIEKQLDSILKQCLQPDEIIICDDCSTDDTWEILNEYAKIDTRFKIYRNKTNLGFLKNFEKALSFCSGDLIALSDQDDIWLSNHLEVLVKGIGDSSVAVGDACLIYDNDKTSSNQNLSKTLGLDFIPDDNLLKSLFILLYQNPYQGASMLLKREFLKYAIPFPKGVKFHDVWFAALACYLNGLSVIPEIITLYRQHNNSVTGYKKRHPKFKTFIGHILFSKYFSDRIPIFNEIRKILQSSDKTLSQKELKFLNDLDSYYKKHSSAFGRIKNMKYELKNYRYIYGCK